MVQTKPSAQHSLQNVKCMFSKPNNKEYSRISKALLSKIDKQLLYCLQEFKSS